MTIHDNQLSNRLYADRLSGLVRDDFFLFVWKVFNQLNGEREAFVPNWHVQGMCYQLSRVADGDLSRLLITVPPRHLKTICTSVALTAWMLGKNPALKVMSASYGQDLAGKSLRDLITVLNSPFYEALFPKTRIKSATQQELRTTTGGGYKPISVGGAVTGFGADIIIVDDLMKASNATSPVRRQEAKDFFEQSLSTRLDNKQNGKIIAIQQRLHEDDLAAHIIDKGTYEILSLPAIALKDEAIPIGANRFHYRNKDDVLFPQREPMATLQRMRIELGNAAFSAQCQQDPSAPDGNMINWSHFKTYDEAPDIHEGQMTVQSWDTGMSAQPTSDYSACLTWRYKDGDWYLIDVYRARLDFRPLRDMVLYRMKKFRADKVIIESATMGLPLIRDLCRERLVGEKIDRYIPRFDKEVRALSQTARLETGNFLVPMDKPWLEEFRRECLAFPSGRHDDMVDALTQFLDWLGQRRGLYAVERVNYKRR
ncbi:Transposase [Aminobacter sp. MSH1]|uniref:phage terminase large subunit n=1 Tax=Aminobacter sp. MSH1 TaxID=374606 RepID=UPI000D399301|nr:phage terminase large subunit [Aminobacter sp. MSH1]AWC21248.1 Transposase [Aminobacter sp. MSH1]